MMSFLTWERRCVVEVFLGRAGTLSGSIEF